MLLMVILAREALTMTLRLTAEAIKPKDRAHARSNTFILEKHFNFETHTISLQHPLLSFYTPLQIEFNLLLRFRELCTAEKKLMVSKYYDSPHMS